MTEHEVLAAGGVVVRDGRVAVVHRPKYDDWSLPKGKLDPGEGFEEAALREVEEETGMRCRLGRELPSTEYQLEGPAQAGALLGDDAAGRRVRAVRRGRRAALAGAKRGRGAPELRARP